MANILSTGAVAAGTEIVEIFRGGSRLRTVPESVRSRPEFPEALAKFDLALNETVDYLQKLKSSPQMYSADKEHELAQLWSNASIAISHLDPALSNSCFIKGQGWLDPKVWRNPAFKNIKIGIEDMRKSRIGFVEQQSNPAPPVPRGVLIAGLFFAVATFASLSYLLLGPDLPPSKQVIFHVWVAFCMAASAAFIGGSAVAKGAIPLPFGLHNPIQISAAGGFGVFVVVLLLLSILDSPPKPPVDIQTTIQDQINSALAVPKNIYAKFATLAESGSAGVVALHADGSALEKLGMRGGGTYYNFVSKKHDYGYGSDVNASNGSFSVGFVGMDFGYVIDFGNVASTKILSSFTQAPPDWVNEKKEAWRYLWSFRPPTTETEARAAQQSRGFKVGNVTIASVAPISAGHFYLLRSVRYRQSDLLIALYVDSTDDSGRYYVVWKELQSFDVPMIGP